MLVIGAKSFAKELLEIFLKNDELENLAFYDDVNPEVSGFLYGRFPILKTESEAKTFFESVDKRFTVGIGVPLLRKKMYDKFTLIGGEYTSIISRKADIGSIGVSIGEGCNILPGVKISNDVTIGRGTMIYYNSVITHDVVIGEFVEISPVASLLGRCRIGGYTHIQSGAVILPDVIVGSHSVIAAGAVVTKDIPDYVMAAGVPAIVKKQI